MADRRRFGTIVCRWVVVLRLYLRHHCWISLQRWQARTERIADAAQRVAYPANASSRVEPAAPSVFGVGSSSLVNPKRKGCWINPLNPGSSPPLTSLPGCRLRGSGSAGPEGCAATTISVGGTAVAHGQYEEVYVRADSDGWEPEISLARFLWMYCHVRPHTVLGGAEFSMRITLRLDHVSSVWS